MRQVALVIETSRGYDRDLLSAIFKYIRMHDESSVFLKRGDLWKRRPSWLKLWYGDGELPQVRGDDEVLGRLAIRESTATSRKHCDFAEALGLRGSIMSSMSVSPSFATMSYSFRSIPAASAIAIDMETMRYTGRIQHLHLE